MSYLGMPYGLVDIYARESKDREGSQIAVTQQIADCRAEAARLGLAVRHVWTDNDISAAQRKKPRKDYQNMLRVLRDDPANVISWHADRLHRQPAELEEYIDLVEPRQIITFTVAASPLDLGTASGQMVARMLGAAARYQIDHMSEQIRARKAGQRLEGKFLGGMRSFGYTHDSRDVCHRDVLMSEGELGRHHLEPLAEVETRRGIRYRVLLPYDETQELATAARRVLAGTAPYRIMTEWERRGVRTAAGYGWSTTRHVSRMLAKPRNAAIVRTPAGDVRAAWPAIISEGEWRRLDRMLGDEARRVTPGPARKWLGSGIYRCGVCGAPLTGSTSPRQHGGRRAVYRCRDAAHVIRDRGALDAWVELHVVAWLEVRGNIPRLAAVPADLKGLEDELAAVRAALDQIAAEGGQRKITARQMAVASAPLIADEERLQGQLEAGGRPDVTGGRPYESGAQLWESLAGDLDRRRAILDMTLSVTVLPQPNGRPPGWRPGESYFHEDCVEIVRKL